MWFVGSCGRSGCLGRNVRVRGLGGRGSGYPLGAGRLNDKTPVPCGRAVWTRSRRPV